MPHLIAIVGSLGAGKTTAASFLPHYFKNKIEARGGSVKLFANYDLKGAEIMQSYEDWYNVAAAHGSIVVWDEAHRNFDSRKFNQFQNILATELLTYVRKMASIQIFATPSINRLDTRIREIIEVLIVVRKTAKGTCYDFYDYQADFAGRYGKYLHTKFVPAFKMQRIHKLNLFDTYSFIHRFPLPNTEVLGAKFMKQLEEYHTETIQRLRSEANNVAQAVIN